MNHVILILAKSLKIRLNKSNTPRIPEDRPYELVESQEVTIRPEQASISGLDPETSRGTAKERPRIPVEPRNIEETIDTHRNPKGYNTLLQLANL